MTQLCPRCMQPLPEEKENEIESNLKELLQAVGGGEVVGLWGTMGYVTLDDIDKRKNVELHAAHCGAFLTFLKLLDSIKNIAIYDSLGTSDEDSEFTTDHDEETENGSK